MTVKYSKKLEAQERRVRAIYISSYIPRKCGIATFTKDLTNAINNLNPRGLAEVLVLNDNGQDYPWEAKFRIDQHNFDTYLTAADYINNSSAELISLQHEFGLFGGENGDFVVPFVEKIKKPLMTTLHTVPSNPLPKQAEIIKALAKKSEAVIVMIDNIAERLVALYGVDEQKVLVIPHGVPDIPFGSTQHFKNLLKIKNKFVLSSINLVSENKGLEFVLQAVPQIIKEVPDFVYLVIGVTHPVVKRHEGEVYRQKLEKICRDLKIEKHVKFINRYLSLDELTNYLRASDAYVTPYLDPEQAASGTLAYAVGAGKACISTPYIYAGELLAQERGILVPFRNSASIAKAVVKLSKDAAFKNNIERNSYTHGRTMIWPSVALQYLDLFRLVLHKREKVLR